VERVKSELIIAAKLLDRLSDLSGDELIGASKIFYSFLEALEGETNIAYNVSGMKNFETASTRVREAADRVSFNQYEEAMESLSEAISHVASIGQWAMQTLKNHSLL
jgi:hypothetical protein